MTGPGAAVLVTEPDEVRDFAGGAETVHTVLFRLPARPDQEWVIVAVPAPTALLDDDRRTARNIALEVASEARTTAEKTVYPALVERRRRG